jgi:NAD(P)-dependent dehydrogenase (short-subunit alcohol dehydrogenase family)
MMRHRYGSARLAAAQQRLSDPARPAELLVKDAGVGTSGSFADVPAGQGQDQIGLNVTALVRLTHAALPAMLSAEPHERSSAGALPSFAWLEPGQVARAGIDAVVAGWALAVPGVQYKGSRRCCQAHSARYRPFCNDSDPASPALAFRACSPPLAAGIRRL